MLILINYNDLTEGFVIFREYAGFTFYESTIDL